MKRFQAVEDHVGVHVIEQAVGYAIVRAHVDATDEDTYSVISLLSLRQIADYHVEVLCIFGLCGARIATKILSALGRSGGGFVPVGGVH